MTASQPNLLELAKQGDVRAIAALMNRQLQPKGITAKVMLKDGCLQVMVEAAQAPEQQASVAFIRKGLAGLGVKAITTVKVYGRQVGKELPVWHQEFKLVEKPSMNLASCENEAIYPTIQDSIIDASNTNQQTEQRDKSVIPPSKYSSAKLADNESHSATSKAKFKLFAASKKNLTVAVLVVVSTLGLTILWLIYSNLFSNKDAVFNSEVSRLLNKGSDPEMNKRLQKMFDDLFGYKKAQEMGKQYCQDRASGLSEEDTSKQAKQAINLMFQQKVTPKEAVNIAIVEVDIHLAANKAYCPQFKPVEQEPLKERLNQQKTSEKDQALAKYKDQTRIPLGRDLTLDATSAKQLDNGLMEVIGRADKDKDLRLRYIVDCGEKTFSMTALNYKAGKEGQWLAVKDPRAERSAAFSALVCP